MIQKITLTWFPVALSAVCLFLDCAVVSAQSGGIKQANGKVEVIETEELIKLIAERQAEIEKYQALNEPVPPSSFVLVDVRSEREMEVSILPTAISKAEFEENIEEYRGRIVIPYCMVGGRCGEFSKKLAEAGWKVKSYRGSIIEWAQNKQPLVTANGEPTTRIHTNGKKFDLPPQYKQVSN